MSSHAKRVSTDSGGGSRPASMLRSEMAVWVGIATALVFLLFGGFWLVDLWNPLKYLVLFAWLFTVMMWLGFTVVRHADSLAALLGEPYGTLILTISVPTSS